MKAILTILTSLVLLAAGAGCGEGDAAPATPAGGDEPTTGSYPVVDTGQVLTYDNQNLIPGPAEGEAFRGQDAQVAGNQPAYRDNGDGTVTDLVTGLMWMQDAGDKMTLAQAQAIIDTFALAGYDDWRLPTIKELYSLILFTGTDPSGLTGDDTSGLTPFLDPVFTFRYGDPDAGERIIDAQYLSSTHYVGLTMGGDETLFGVNFADGRIKGYPLTGPLHPEGFPFFALFVRGDDYGTNDFIDNGDGTVTDRATGLMWMQQDSGHLQAGEGGGGGLNWRQALAWADTLQHAGRDDWRLPSVKELQSLVDYTRSPLTHGTAAIDPVFASTPIVDEGGGSDFAFYWSGTTHANSQGLGFQGAYVAFGTGYGFMEMPPGSGNHVLSDVHGAGCQRSDPKDGDPADYPVGWGPQGDVIRIFNLVRCVRQAE